MTLKQLIENGDIEAVKASLNKLSSSAFRSAEGQVRQIMMGLSNDRFWEVYCGLLKYRKHSFLSCILSVGHLARSGQLSYDCQGARELRTWIQSVSPESARKIASMALTKLTDWTQVVGLLRTLGGEEAELWAPMLLKEGTVMSYYVLFGLLRRTENNELVQKCIQLLMKSGNDLSFNMASILTHYFGVEGVNAVFSLKLEPYELSYIEQSYENFEHIINGKRPRI